MGFAITFRVDIGNGVPAPLVMASCLRDLYRSLCFFMWVLCHTHATTPTAATHTAVATGTTTLTLESLSWGTQLNSTARSAAVSPQHNESLHWQAH